MDKLLLIGIGAALGLILGKQCTINKKLNQLIMTNEEAIAKLDAQATQLEKVRTEVQTLIDAATNQGNVSPELEAAINRVQAAIQTVDDQNADAEPPVEG